MPTETLVLVAVLGLAGFRLTRLVAADDFPPVAAVRGRLAAARWDWVGELVTCPWCASGWVTLGLVALGNVSAARGGYGGYDWGADFLVTWWATWAVAAVLADRLG